MSAISIIIPVYNVAPYLRECLDSVSAQTFSDWEAICVDDGSTDGSSAILDEYAAKDSRFRVVHQANGGVSSARNTALDIAQGKWVSFLDADDKVLCHWLEDIAQAAKNHPDADWIRTRYRDLHMNGDTVCWPEGHKLYEKAETVGKNDIVLVAWRKFSRVGVPGLNTFKRSLICNQRYALGMIWSEDILFSIMAAIRANSCVVIGNEDYLYRIREGSAAHSAQNASVLIPFLEQVLPIWSAKPGNSEDMTFLVTKNFRRLFGYGGKCSIRDGFRLRNLLLRLREARGFSLAAIPDRKMRFRWRLFLATGVAGFIHWPLNPTVIMRCFFRREGA
jgi:glycosyltransferase involved in cell wall biosynthesis